MERVASVTVADRPLNVVVAPDSFKGSLSSSDACLAIERGIVRVFPNARIRKVPMADGGEGTVEAVLTAVGGEWRHVEVMGPLQQGVTASYGVLRDGVTAVIEMAAASGLTLVPEEQRNPLRTTTFGTGQLILHAIENGCTRILIGLGGSATNDGGMGMAQALGVEFLDAEGKPLGLGGDQLERIAAVNLSHMDDRLKQTEVLICCDVTNPLCGLNGASFVYGPQKGATPKIAARLDQGLEHYAMKIFHSTGKKIKDLPGAGAAGGMGAALMAFCEAKLRPGFQLLSELAGLDESVRKADLVITGEGKTDGQTVFGKVPAGIGNLAKRHGKPAICVSGSITPQADALYEQGITALFSTVSGPMPLEDAMLRAEELLANAAENVMRVWRYGTGMNA